MGENEETLAFKEAENESAGLFEKGQIPLDIAGKSLYAYITIGN
jgi:hypothetical protein